MASKSRWGPLAALFKSSQPAPVRVASSKAGSIRTAKPKRPVANSHPSTDPHPYHAVSILAGANACSAAHRFKGFRFLSRQAPKLPLPTCDVPQCNCRFKHHKDRRAGLRRRSDQGMMAGIYDGTERRRIGGRRADDH